MDSHLPSPESRKRKVRDEEEQLEPSLVATNSRLGQPSGFCLQTPVTPGFIAKRPRYDTYLTCPTSDAQPSLNSSLCDSHHIQSDTPSPLSTRPLYTIQSYMNFPEVIFGPCLPSLHPPINRRTLRDLDLSAVLQNPLLRHDLLFDPSLHFRTSSHPKKERHSNIYWDAILQEVSTGCTCLTFGKDATPISCVCICDIVPLPEGTVVLFEDGRVSVRTSPRLHNLLEDFLEVLLMVIQPLARSPADMYRNEDILLQQMKAHASIATHVRTSFDPELIEQEIAHGVFDPSSLFELVGDTLRRHCAPLRDNAITHFVQRSGASLDGSPATATDVVAALRMCMDVLELMQLDIANHQLRTLRPILTKTTPQFEMNVFHSQHGPRGVLDSTKSWLRASRDKLEHSEEPILKAPFFSRAIPFSSLTCNRQIFICGLRGFVDLIFSPPSLLPIVPNGLAAMPLCGVVYPILPLPDFPETTFMDNSRLLQLAGDALDLISLHLYLLLFRQLVLTSRSEDEKGREPSESSLISLRNHIYQLSSSRPGHSILPSALGEKALDSIPSAELEQRLNSQSDIVLQVARCASEEKLQGCKADLSLPYVDPTLLKLAQNWTAANFHMNSDLFIMLRDRLSDIVFQATLVTTFPSYSSSPFSSSETNFTKRSLEGDLLFTPLLDLPTASGLQPLRSYIHLLSVKTTTMVLHHFNTYLALYEQEGFLD